MGVTSRMLRMERPADSSERMAASRPEPGPFTSTSTWRMPCSIARLATRSAAWPAANGVDLREPLKPTVPALPAATTLPLGSVSVTCVLLNVDWMYARPLGTDFFSLRRDLPLRSAMDGSCLLLLGYHAALASHRLARALARAGVGSRALAPHRQTAPVPDAAVAVGLDQALDVLADVTAQVALDCAGPVDDLADP